MTADAIPGNAYPGPIIMPYRGVWPKIDPSAFIAPGAVIIGDVEVGAEAGIWFGCVLRGDDAPIRIGMGTNIQDGTVIHVTLDVGPTIIGENVTVGHGARLHGCLLEERCLVGIGAIVLDGAIVETEGFLAAGALLAPGKRVPGGELWGGSPARKLRELRDADREYIDFDFKHYRKLAGEFRSEIQGAA